MGTAESDTSRATMILLINSADHTVSRWAFSSSRVSNLFAMMVRSNPIVVSAFAAAMMVKAMANRPKSSGASRRARVTERRNPMNCPTRDEVTFQLMPERTLVTSGKVVAIYPGCILYHNQAWQSHTNLAGVLLW